MNKETKVVKYLGQIYEVPVQCKFIAMDNDGSVFAYDFEPVWCDEGYTNNGGGFYSVGNSHKHPPCIAI